MTRLLSLSHRRLAVSACLLSLSLASSAAPPAAPPAATITVDAAGRSHPVNRRIFGHNVEDELYDLRTDPGETTNVAAAYPAQVTRIRARLASEMLAVDDPLVRTPDFKPFV